RQRIRIDRARPQTRGHRLQIRSEHAEHSDPENEKRVDRRSDASGSMMKLLRWFGAAGIASLAVTRPASSEVETSHCLLQYETSSGNTRTNAVKTASGQYNFFQGGGVTYHCEGQNNTLQADSAEYYGDQKVLYLIGSVHYTEPRAKVDSERMTYFQIEDRIRAEGNVN